MLPNIVLNFKSMRYHICSFFLRACFLSRKLFLGTACLKTHFFCYSVTYAFLKNLHALHDLCTKNNRDCEIIRPVDN